MADDYAYYVIETYRAAGEPSANAIRARPLPGQSLSADLKVECPVKMREGHKVGTKYKIRAKITDREGGTPFLYTSYHWGYTVLNDEQVAQFMRENFGAGS